MATESLQWKNSLANNSISKQIVFYMWKKHKLFWYETAQIVDNSCNFLHFSECSQEKDQWKCQITQNQETKERIVNSVWNILLIDTQNPL